MDGTALSTRSKLSRTGRDDLTQTERDDIEPKHSESVRAILPRVANLKCNLSRKEVIMPYITVGKENGSNVDIYYKDWGKGQPIVFSHGWPLSADDWDAQMLFFLKQGYRVVAHDRRGHGRSTQTSDGHDMDHYAADLAALTAHLALNQAVHVGHSTGGGEVAHYPGRHGE